MSTRVTATVTVPGENGLHLVPCSLIAQNATAFACEIRISKGDRNADAKNIFDLMTLAAGQGAQLLLEAAGDQANEAVQSLVQLFESGFNGHSHRTHS